MTQRLALLPTLPPDHYLRRRRRRRLSPERLHHLLHLPMGTQSLSQPHHSVQSPNFHPSTSDPTAAPAVEPSSSYAALSLESSFPSAIAPSEAATKIPFRPRKIRKVSPSPSSTPAAADDAPAAVPYSSRLALRVIPRPLSASDEIDSALRHLCAADPLLAGVIEAHEPPTFQCVNPPFQSLTRSILYQQLAFKAGVLVYARFLALCGGEAGVVPEAVLALTPHQLRQIGVSARKASYIHDLAHKYHSGILSDAAIVAMDDKTLFSMLTMVKGIGAWSVHMFMIFSLHRPDVLPVGDQSVRKGVQMLYGLEDVPRPSQMEQLCERWRPYRSVGSWYMWRLVETKAYSNSAASALDGNSIGGITISSIVGGGGVGTVQQTALTDQMQMLPNLG